MGTTLGDTKVYSIWGLYWGRGPGHILIAMPITDER